MKTDSKKRTAIILSLAKRFKKLEEGKLVKLSYTIPAIKVSEQVRIEWEEEDFSSIENEREFNPNIAGHSNLEREFLKLSAKCYDAAKKKLTKPYNLLIVNFVSACDKAASFLGEDRMAFFRAIEKVKNELYE